MYGAVARGPGAQPQLPLAASHPVAEVRVEGVVKAENPGGLVAEALGQREVEELLPQPLVSPVPAPDEEEDNHGKEIEHEEEAGADADGKVFAFRQPFTSTRSRGLTYLS